MVTPEVINYIKGELQKGKTRADIEKELFLGGGWSATDLDEAFKAATGAGADGKSVTVQKVTRPHKQVRLLWVIILMLIAGYCGWWFRDRQQFFQIQKLPTPQAVVNSLNQ